MPLSVPPSFLEFAISQADEFIRGFDLPPLDPGPVRSLEATLEGLDQRSDEGHPITFAAVRSALLAPPQTHSKDALKDFRKLITKYASMYGKVARITGERDQRIYEPLHISASWLVVGVGTPHWRFVRASPEQQQSFVEGQMERKLISSMPLRARMRLYRTSRRIDQSALPKQTICPAMRRKLNKLLREDTDQ
jgi:hypothetical protein